MTAIVGWTFGASLLVAFCAVVSVLIAALSNQFDSPWFTISFNLTAAASLLVMFLGIGLAGMMLVGS